jgi:hypothetical protein
VSEQAAQQAHGAAVRDLRGTVSNETIADQSSGQVTPRVSRLVHASRPSAVSGSSTILFVERTSRTQGWMIHCSSSQMVAC